MLDVVEECVMHSLVAEPFCVRDLTEASVLGRLVITGDIDDDLDMDDVAITGVEVRRPTSCMASGSGLDT